MSNSSYFLSSSSCLFLFFLSTNWLIICLTINAETGLEVATQNETRFLVHIGAVLDMKSPMYRTLNVCLSMALSDFYAAHPNYRTKLILQTRDSSDDLLDSASSVISLLESGEVHGILGLQRSAKSSFVKKLGEKAFVPIISISSTSLSSPSPSSNPYFIKISQDDSSQVNAITSLIRKFGWNEVILIYEENIQDGNELFSSLITNSLQEMDILVAYNSVINPRANESQILNELKVLKSMQTKVLLVHMSVDLGPQFFTLIERENMMSKGYAWIITDSLSNSFEAMDPSAIASMKGVIGIQSHVPESKNLDKFKSRFELDTHSMSYPMVKISGLNIYGLLAYDTIWALASAAEKIGVRAMDSSFSKTKNKEGTCSKNLTDLETSKIGPRLLEEVSNMTLFRGLSGDFKLVDGQLQARTLEVFNVIEKMKIVIGYWNPAKRILTKHLGPNPNTSMTNELKSIIWPGNSKETPMGKKLRIGVPWPHLFIELVNLNEKTGFCLEVFKAVWDVLPFKLDYQFEGSVVTTYDELCKQVYNKTFDAVVGDITIMASRTNMVDFTLPYLDSRVAMLIKIRGSRNHIWTFLQPLSWDLWLMLLISCCSVGVVVRILERRVNEEFKGPARKQITTILLFPFQSVVYPQIMVMTYCSKVVLVTWLFLAFVIMQSYTANLSSIFTVDRLQGKVPSLGELRKSNVCYQRRSFIKGFLIRNLKFNEGNLKSCGSIDEFHDALSNGSVAAVFAETPYIKVFLMKYSSGFKSVGMTSNTNGFGFAFPLGSRLTPIVSAAILNVTQGPIMSGIEKQYFNTEDMSGGQADPDSSTSSSLTTKTFEGLFLLVAITILLALLISERNVWERFIMKYILHASSESNTQSRVDSMAEAQDLDIHRLQENFVEMRMINVEMIDMDFNLRDQSNVENLTPGTSNSN